MALISGSAAWWDQRYIEGRDGWELGEPAPPLRQFFNDHPAAPAPPARVLVPGCGRGHEATLLAELGFEVIGLDLSAEALRAAQALHGSHHRLQWLQGDLLDSDVFPASSFDGFLEHTCYCAMDPAQRPAYRAAAHRLIRPGGWLAGLFWCHSRPGGPPYGSDPASLQAAFTALGFAPELWFAATNSACGREPQPREQEWMGLWRRLPGT